MLKQFIIKPNTIAIPGIAAPANMCSKNSKYSTLVFSTGSYLKELTYFNLLGFCLGMGSSLLVPHY